MRTFLTAVAIVLLGGCEPEKDRPFTVLCAPYPVSPGVATLRLTIDPQRLKIFRTLDHAIEQKPLEGGLSDAENPTSSSSGMKARSQNERFQLIDYCPMCTVTVTQEQITAIDFQDTQYRLDIDRLSGSAVEQAHAKTSASYMCSSAPDSKIPEPLPKF